MTKLWRGPAGSALKRLRRAGLTGLGLTILACGARTALREDAPLADAGVAADAGLDAAGDAPPDSSPPLCVDDTQCDDGLFCTVNDRCTPDGCRSDPRRCSDGVACTLDACDEGTRACIQSPDDNACPISHRCDPVSGCQARVLTHYAGQLYNVSVPGGWVTTLGNVPLSLGDVALAPTGIFYAVTTDGTFLSFDPNSGDYTSLFSIAAGLNGLEVAPDGTLYASGDTKFYRVDLMVGLIEVASFPPGMSSAGDIAFIDRRMFATAALGSGNAASRLVEVELQSGESRVIGSTNFRCVYGLAAFGETLYGFTCSGQVLTIDVNSGNGSLVSTSTVQFWGAAAR